MFAGEQSDHFDFGARKVSVCREQGESVDGGLANEAREWHVGIWCGEGGVDRLLRGDAFAVADAARHVGLRVDIDEEDAVSCPRRCLQRY